MSTTKPLADGRSVQKLGLAFLDQTVDGILPPGSDLSVWAFASPTEVRSVWHGNPQEAQDLAAIQEWLTANPRNGEGTYVAPAISEALAAAKRSAAAHRDCWICLITDGEFDDAGKMDAAFAQLAKVPGVKAIVVLPVSTGGTYRTAIDHALLPFGDRAIVAGPSDILQADTHLRKLIGN